MYDLIKEPLIYKGSFIYASFCLYLSHVNRIHFASFCVILRHLISVIIQHYFEAFFENEGTVMTRLRSLATSIYQGIVINIKQSGFSSDTFSVVMQFET